MVFLLSNCTAFVVKINFSFFEHVPRSVLWVLGAILAINNSVLIWHSLDWPLMWDAPAYHYIAWLMSQGAVPYRDIFDQNLPLTYLIHLFVITFIGTGSTAWRFTDLFCLTLIDGFIIAYMKKYGVLATVLAVCLFSAFHLLNGAFHTGERDYFIVVCIAAAFYFLAAALECVYALHKLALAGFFIGAGIMIKPHVGVLLLLLALTVALSAYKAGRAWLQPVFVFISGGLVVPAALIIWLAVTGGLLPFFDLFFNYLPAVYPHIGKTPLTKTILIHRVFGVPLVVVALAAAAASLAYFTTHKQIDMRRTLLTAGLAYGLLHHLGQRGAFLYHTYPLYFFIFLITASWIPLLQKLRSRKLYALMLALLLYLSAVYAIKSAQRIISPHHYNIDYVVQLMQDLKDFLAPGDTIQTDYYHTGAAHALFLLGYPQVTRFVFTFHFYYLIDNPFIKKLRREYLTVLQKKRPTILVISAQPATGGHSYERIEQFPELNAWIHQQYYLARERYEYRIYKLKNNGAISSVQ